MRKKLQISLIFGALASWFALGTLIVRQHRLMEVADPMRDTGLSFGYVFLTRFASLALVVLTAIIMAILAWMKRSKRVQSTLGNGASAISHSNSKYNETEQ